MISKINLAKSLGIKHRLDLNLDSKPQHKSIILKLIRTNTDQSLMSKINAAKTLGIKHRLDLDLDSKPQHRSIESRASSFPKKNPEHHGFTTATVLPQEQQASNYAKLTTTCKGEDEHRLIHVPMYDQSKRLKRPTSSSSSASVAAAAGAATTTAAAHVILCQERGDRGREHCGPLLGSRGGLRA